VSALHRFFVGAGVIEGDRARLTGEHAKQIADVLRLGAGDRVVLVRDGQEAEVRLRGVARSAVEGDVIERRPAGGEPRVRLTLALPLLRGDRSEEVVEAVTQLGVSRIVPFTSARSVVKDLPEKKLERWRRIARESAETARRGRIPGIDAPLPWERLFDALEPPVIVAWEGERDLPLKEAVSRGGLFLSLIVGPEGGLSSEEVGLARSRGAAIVSLGSRNLRSETAAIAAVAQIIALSD
jgi:16S rRNA (uracil1498-N3)-methyltransferase